MRLETLFGLIRICSVVDFGMIRNSYVLTLKNALSISELVRSY